ncbi:MAG TPA: cytochrome c oxidase subunit II [Microlunatus sp.]|jgi:cytochrome c oxidase subunit 2|nr:cytochrome c oxidase subunit II [Microlunatus sp.]
MPELTQQTRSSAHRRRLKRPAAAAAGVLGMVFMASCSIQDTTNQVQRLGLPAPASNNADSIGNLWLGTWIAAGAVGILVWGLIGFAVLRYRRRKNLLPRQNRYNLPMEIMYTIVPFVIIGVLFYFTVVAQNKVLATSPDPDVKITVVGQKWSWSFNYKSADDPAVGEDVYNVGTIDDTPDLYLPVGKNVQFDLRSPDVIHSFWIPAFYQKLDVVPGRDNFFQVTPTKEGVFAGKCAELCGTYHSAMLFNVHVVSEAEYTEYLKSLVEKGQIGEVRGPAENNAPPPAAEGEQR